jgi:hypothetical protein
MEDLRNRPTRIDTATGHPWGIQYGPVFLGVSTRKRDDDSRPGVFAQKAANFVGDKPEGGYGGGHGGGYQTYSLIRLAALQGLTVAL